MRTIKLAFILFLPVLFFPGIPGAGKCVLAGTISADTVSRDSALWERLRRHEEAVIRREEPRRDSMSLTRRPYVTMALLAERERVEREWREASGIDYRLAVRANLLRWVTLTPDIGVEWRVNDRWGVTLGGAWTSWRWKDGDRRYALWEVNAGGRYYLGDRRRWHAGIDIRAGEFNRKLGHVGRQGHFAGAGASGGYRLRLCRSLWLDAGIGVGCTRERFDKYTLIDGARVRGDRKTRYRWGVTSGEIAIQLKIKN